MGTLPFDWLEYYGTINKSGFRPDVSATAQLEAKYIAQHLTKSTKDAIISIDLGIYSWM